MQEAHAKEEAARSLSRAEIERAKGAAEANRIIGQSLEKNEAYLHYLGIHNLAEPENDVIYVTTEAGLSIFNSGEVLPKKVQTPP